MRVVCALVNPDERPVFFQRLVEISGSLDAAHRISSGQFSAVGSPYGAQASVALVCG